MPRWIWGLLALLALALAVRPSPPPVAAGAPFDVVIRNGRVLDGSGNPWTRADIGIRDGRIAALGRLEGAAAARVIDAAGRHVTPGFIDTHSHAVDGLLRPGLQQAQPLLAQGITTIVANPDGGGPVDLAGQRDRLERQGTGVNVALLIGHGSVRRAVLGMEDRAPDAAELARMADLVRRAMRDGAFGLSSGLFYAPGSYADTSELAALALVAGESGGVYASHIRDEGDYGVGLLAAVDEAIRIAEEARVTAVLTHLKALGPASWGLSGPALERIETARARGVPVFADQYPYDASSTSLAGALLPVWAFAGGEQAMQRRLAAPDARPRLLAAMRENLERRGGAATIVVAHAPAASGVEGRSLAAIAGGQGQSPEEAALRLIAAGGASIVSFNMSEEDIVRIMTRPYVMTCTDGTLVFPTEGRPHPRSYGAFPRKLARYVREQGALDFESAIRSMTSLPAVVFGLADRGSIRPGAHADLLVFDPARVRDAATYADPHRLAEGMDYVLVNGVVVREEGRFSRALPGRVLRPN